MTLLASDDVGTSALSPERLTSYGELDVRQAVRRYRRLTSVLPRTAVRHTVGADPHPAPLSALAGVGCKFFVTGPAEVRACLAAGAKPGDLVHTHPITRRADTFDTFDTVDMVGTAALGVRLFVVSSLEETLEVAEAAPGSAVLCRLVTGGDGSDQPFSRPHGCSTTEAVAVLRRAARSGLDPAGISFHVGSQQQAPQAWAAPIAASARVFSSLRAVGLRPWLLDLGGGLPAALEGGAPPLALFGAFIDRALRQEFGVGRPRTLVESGLAVVGPAHPGPHRSAAIR